MIRSDFDISDADFEKVNKPFADALDKYLRENFIDEYMAFYIAIGYKMDALFEGSLSGVFNAAIDNVCDLHFGTEDDIGRLKSILKNKYNLLLASDTNLEIEEIQVQDQ